jgi:hypothetical protein
MTPGEVAATFPLSCPRCSAPMRRLSKLCLRCATLRQKERDAERKRNPAGERTCMWCRFSKQGPCVRHGGLPTKVKKVLNHRASRAKVTA